MNSHSVATYKPANMSIQDLEGMFRLRYEVFHEKLGWRVQVTSTGLEMDGYDNLPGVAYVLAKSVSAEIDGCWRLLPTTGPYMLRDTFPELLHGVPAPAAADCYELSRFAVATDRVETANANVGPISMALMRASADFAVENGIHRYVTVTTPVMERMLRQKGINVHRIGPSLQIGISAAVALMIEVDNITLSAVGMSQRQ